ncbi:MAG: shikimate kinase [Verrucomicrobiales bacterium]|nr:shikimate kinase [Verrucomicrobiales bacterium]
MALIGFMGVGKSTVAGLAAGLLRFQVIDTDRVIEERSGRRISDIFATDGEGAFRDREAALVLELESQAERVIATGGGLPMNPDNFASLQKHSFIVCLWASAETIYQRVRSQGHRPLLQAPDPLERIRTLLTERTPVYRRADLMVGVDFRAPLETARTIVAAFRQARTEAHRESLAPN